MAMVLGVVGGVISAMGAMQQANSQAAAADYNAQVAERNKRATLKQTDAAIDDKRLENRRQMATLRASYGQSGLMLDGAPLDVLEDSATEMAYDVSKIKYQGRMKAEGYSEQAALYKLEAKSAKQAGTIGAASAIIGGISSGLSAWTTGSGGSVSSGSFQPDFS